MYKKIMATLDGSVNAECVLPYAEDLNKKYGAEVILLSVLEPIVTMNDEQSPTADAWRQLEAVQKRLASDRQQYLSQKEKELRDKGVKVRSVVLSGGKAAEQIIDYAKKEGVDAIVIATHGHSGAGRWAYGHVAEKVVRGATVHTMLVRCALPPGAI